MERYIGKLLDGRYEILEIIGVGGMAVVYKAMDHRLNRLVAVKILKDDYLNDADFRRRFHGESQAVAMLSHPNIVSVYDVSKSDGMEYIVMELIDGITLKQYMDQRSPLSWRETLHFSMQIAKALEHAHSRGIIHRDIKPHNVMILKDGSVKVADFGIARIASAQNTLTKEALGSVHYISPEQARGARVDNRSDIYSLGVVMYEMLTGRPPYDGETPVSVAIQHINGTPLSPSLLNGDIPTGLEQITMHAMCSDINIRYASVTDMLKDMEEFRKNPGIRFTFLPKGSAGVGAVPNVARVQQGKTQSSVNRQKELEREYERQDREEKRRRTWMIIAISLAVVALVGLLILILGQRGSETPTAPSTTAAASVTTLPNEVIVPPLVGSIFDEIPQENYPYIRIVYNESSYVYHDKYPAGVVCDQRPGVGERVPPGTEIFVYISLGEETDTMPDLKGYSAENANSLLKALRIELTILTDREYSAETEADHVTRTDPEAGTELKNGQVVRVYLSQGREKVKVPDVEGASLSNATASVNARGLEIAKREEYSSSVAEGYVISQSPVSGTEVEAGSTVTVIISKGKQTVTLPSVVGQTEAAAASTLDRLGLMVQTKTEYNLYVPAGQVIRQSPDSNAELMPGSTVTLTISLGPEPEPSSSSEPEPSSSSEPEPSSSSEPEPAPGDGENP